MLDDPLTWSNFVRLSPPDDTPNPQLLPLVYNGFALSPALSIDENNMIARPMRNSTTGLMFFRDRGGRRHYTSSRQLQMQKRTFDQTLLPQSLRLMVLKMVESHLKLLMSSLTFGVR